MRVRLTTGVAGGPYDGEPGDVRDVPDDIGDVWLEIGYAERVDEPSGETNMLRPEGERAIAPPPGETPGGPPRGERARKRRR